MMKYFGKKVYRHSGFPSLFSIFALALFWCTQALATDYSDGDIHKNDYKWFQFNLMQSQDNKLPFGNEKDTYFEMEFGGRNGIVSLYGYLDVFDIFNSSKDDLHKKDNFFLKFAPRFSLDGILRTDLAVGSLKEWYISTITNVADKSLFEHFVGLGADIELPWFGVVGSNLLARYARENFGAKDEGKWSGYIFANNWFKPFYFFDDKSFIAYQGYLDYKFGYDKLYKESKDTRTKTSFEWFHGFYWHSDQWAAGYGLKYYRDMANFKDGASYGSKKQNTTGFGHYFDVTYKF
ncbi:outer membrane protein OmpK [Sansalvadorimonas sp. 2012CJ34-2]|uniref:Outer membrane protein OmpK n=1 Tax=Parendozoicomonas callyspongiae TaxID=2942213 RepID=A0ABT0PFW9_9GAMM|nr:outer membrane protein OmpK [Sansalvadorimonas sp. 2012CJ34-2]MCL6269662.1 outer membrane protein OmpK [Sansalvadorimonas sp. 2012CJ34-2]